MGSYPRPVPGVTSVQVYSPNPWGDESVHSAGVGGWVEG